MTCSAAKRISVLRVFNRSRPPRGADRDSSQMLSGHSTLRHTCPRFPSLHISPNQLNALILLEVKILLELTLSNSKLQWPNKPVLKL